MNPENASSCSGPNGDAWRYVRPDGALSGCHHVETLRTDERTTFAGRAEVLRVQP